jgi:hypothetical protein
MIRKKGISAQQNQTITVNQYTKLTPQNAEKLSNSTPHVIYIRKGQVLTIKSYHKHSE